MLNLDFLNKFWPRKEDQKTNIAAIQPATTQPLLHSYDTLSSATSEELAVSNVNATKAPKTGNACFQDTLSTYESDNIDISTTIATSKSKSEANAGTSSTTPFDIDFDMAPDALQKNYKEALANAGQETHTIIKQAKLQAASVVSLDANKDSLSERIKALSTRIDEMLKMDNVNFEALEAMFLKSVIWHMRSVAKEDQKFTSDQKERIRKQALDVKKAYASWAGLTGALVSGGMSIAGGAAGLAPFAVGAITSQTAQMLAAAATPLSNTGMGTSSLTGVLNSRDNSNKSYEEHELGEMKNRKETASERKRGNVNVIDQAKRQIDEENNKRHQVASNFLSPN